VARSAYRKGRRLEHRARALLAAAGYSVVRAAGSKGPVDLIAFNETGFRLVSVKSGSTYASADERAVLELLARPQNASLADRRPLKIELL
jgi:Holliday junction resolvase